MRRAARVGLSHPNADSRRHHAKPRDREMARFPIAHVWHSIYDLDARRIDVSFFLGVWN